MRAHPFTDGNGRTTRLLADLVLITAQDPAEFQYNWDLSIRIETHRDARKLAAFVGVQPIEF